MLKAILTSIMVPGMALFIAMPAPTFAEPPSRAGSHVQRRSAHRPEPNKHNPGQPQRYRRHDRRHARDVRHHRPNVSQHQSHRRPHRHHGVHIGVNIGGYAHRPPYPHGHAHHLHNNYCPVVIRPVILVPTWEVYYHPHHYHSAAAILHIVVGSFSGALYIDGQYHGEAHHLHDGRLEIPVSPGLHTVQLHYDGRTHSQQVHAKPGATAVVKANQS